MSRRSRVMILSVLVLGSVVAAFFAIRLTLASNDLALTGNRMTENL